MECPLAAIQAQDHTNRGAIPVLYTSRLRCYIEQGFNICRLPVSKYLAIAPLACGGIKGVHHLHITQSIRFSVTLKRELRPHPPTMTLSLRILDIVIFTFCVFVLFKIRAKLSHKGRTPPGPKGWPVIGNLLDVPLEEPWKTFSEWGSRYGMVSRSSKRRW